MVFLSGGGSTTQERAINQRQVFFLNEIKTEQYFNLYSSGERNLHQPLIMFKFTQ